MTESGQAALWDAVRAGLRAQRAAPAIAPADRGIPLPAGFAQEGMWLSEQLAGPSAQHNLCVAMSLRGRLDPAALGRSLEALLERHEILRTRLEWSEGGLHQIILPPQPLVLPIEPLPGGIAALERIASEEARRVFDLTKRPLPRARLLRLDEDTHGLILTFHHLAFDGWSFEVFMGELGQLYGAFRAGQGAPLPPPALQYADYAVWQRLVLQGDRLRELTGYWSTQMAEPPAPLRLPADRPGSPHAVRRGDCMSLALPEALSRGIRTLASAEAATPFMVLLAAYQVLLSRHSGEENVAVGSPAAQRNRAELRDLVGPLVNILVFRCRVSGDSPFRRFLAEVRETVLAAYAHQEYPFELLAAASPHWRGADGGFPVSAMFTYLNLPGSGWTLPGLAVEAWNVHHGTARYDLSLTVRETEGGLCGQFEYDAERFDPRYIQSLARQWETLLGGIVANPECPVAELPLLSEPEIRTLRALTAGPKPAYPREMPIHGVFETVARTRPDATALVFGAERLSYGALDRRAGQLAQRLRERHIKPGNLVGLCFPASPDYVVAALAVLKVGAAYVPLDPGEPLPRIRVALRGSRLAAVLTHEALPRSLVGLDAPLLTLDALHPSGDYRAADDPAPADWATAPAYVMFTSGSTGTPKAVCIPHRGVVRLARAANYAELGPAETMLMLAPLAFDASTFELWGALLTGATLVIPTESRPSLNRIADLVRSHEVSTLWLTTGLFEAMLEAEPMALARPRQVLVGGEVLSPAAARKFLRLSGAGRLINCYGPTECTTFTTFHPVSEADPEGSVPIGRPLAHAGVHLLDSRHQPVPRGVVGEAWITGDGLMLGYLDDARANAASLWPDPVADQPRQFMYRSGDRMRLRFDGNLEFAGRIDRQVKIRGFRVEPGEIETVLAAHPRVAQAAVVAEGAGSDKRLLVYVAARHHEADGPELAAELLDWLRSRLPEPLRPAKILILPELPLKANGKLDHDALPRPPTWERQAEMPRDPLERRVAEAFAETLGLPGFARDEDFFAAGGHSLLALQLVARLESALAVRLPLVALFQHPTPEGLAAHLRTHRPPAPEPVAGIAEVRRGAEPPPLFMVPGGHGGMLELTLYARLMGHVHRDMAVYGLLAESPLPNSAESLAELYLARLRRVQPQGPYALAGECVGGVIAYEMARQLCAAGETVALLILLDTWCPSPRRRWRYRWLQLPLRLLGLPASRWRREWDELIGAGNRMAREEASGRAGAGPVRWYRSLRKLARAVGVWWRRRAFGRRYIGLAMSYRPAPCPVPLHLLLSETNHRLGLASGWEPLAKRGLRLWVAPGTHETYLHDTLEIAAQALNASLESVFGNPE